MVASVRMCKYATQFARSGHLGRLTVDLEPRPKMTPKGCFAWAIEGGARICLRRRRRPVPRRGISHAVFTRIPRSTAGRWHPRARADCVTDCVCEQDARMLASHLPCSNSLPCSPRYSAHGSAGRSGRGSGRDRRSGRGRPLLRSIPETESFHRPSSAERLGVIQSPTHYRRASAQKRVRCFETR